MTNITIGYCKKCRQNVLLTREKINLTLVIFLLIFTLSLNTTATTMINKGKTNITIMLRSTILSTSVICFHHLL